MTVDPFFDYQFRLILIGDSTVGKSSLLKCFTDGRFTEFCDPTVGVDFYSKIVEVKKGIKVKMQLWDTAGQERFRSITRSYYRNSVGGLLVYDITNRASFESLPEWLYEARYHLEPRKGVFLLIGHKTDIAPQRVVSTDEGKAFADENGLRFVDIGQDGPKRAGRLPDGGPGDLLRVGGWRDQSGGGLGRHQSWLHPAPVRVQRPEAKVLVKGGRRCIGETRLLFIG